MGQSSPLPWQTEAIALHSDRLLNSFQALVGRPLLNAQGSQSLAQQLFEAAFVVLSHGQEPDPVLNYGNQMALDLWQLDWEQFTQMPSRYTAEPMEREERDRLLQQAKTQGYISNYSGVRISSTGQRFWINDAIIWTVKDEAGTVLGQAATFSEIRYPYTDAG